MYNLKLLKSYHTEDKQYGSKAGRLDVHMPKPQDIHIHQGMTGTIFIELIYIYIKFLTKRLYIYIACRCSENVLVFNVRDCKFTMHY